jgi:hypothetical protein
MEFDRMALRRAENGAGDRLVGLSILTILAFITFAGQKLNTDRVCFSVSTLHQ